MARSETIKSFVERRTLEGASARECWDEARTKFPHKCVGWNYITNLRRDAIDTAIAKRRLNKMPC